MALKRPAIPADNNLVAMYIGHLVSAPHPPKPLSVASTLSASAYYHKLASQLDPTAFVVHKVLQGLQKTSPTGDARIPVSLPLLQSLLAAIPKVGSSTYEVSLFRALFSLLFHAFLRIGEADSPHNIPHHNVPFASMISVLLRFFNIAKLAPLLYIVYTLHTIMVSRANLVRLHKSTRNPPWPILL